MKKVIITGADGFIGSNLIKKLGEEGIEVWAIIYPKHNFKTRIEKYTNVHCIECELSELKNHVREFPIGVDVFYHFAWQGVNANDRNNMDLQLENINLCLECIRFAKLLSAKKFILPGSTSEYLYYGHPIDENALPSPQNAYGSVKVAVRYLATRYAAECNLGFIYTVITGIYAADRRDNNVLFYTIDKLLRKERPSLTRLEQLWDYVNIKDVTEALYLIGEYGKNGEFYAIGKGDNQPLYNYIEIIRRNIDQDAEIGIGDIPYAGNKLPSSCIDISKLHQDTGYIPKVEFKDGIREVIEQIREEKKYDK